jgi:hypothetical protein
VAFRCGKHKLAVSAY